MLGKYSVLVGMMLALAADGFSTVQADPAQVPVKYRVSFSPEYGGLPAPAVDVRAKPIARKPPVYPKKFQDTDIKGTAVIEFIVDEKGKVREAQVAQASDQAFGDAARAAVEKWTFQPALKGGSPTWSRLVQAIEFSPPVPAANKIRR